MTAAIGTHTVLGAYMLGIVVGLVIAGVIAVIVLSHVLDRIDRATAVHHQRHDTAPVELPAQRMARVNVADLPRRTWTA